MRLPRFRKKFIAGALAAGLVMGAGGIAAAYYTSSGTGTGGVHTGTAGPFKVTVATPTTKTLTPTTATESTYGTDKQLVRWVVKNDNPGYEHLDKVVISVSAFSAQANATLPACTAATFQLTNVTAPFSRLATGAITVTVTAVTAPTGSTLNPGEDIFTTVAVRLINNHQNQDNCETVSVTIHVAAS